MGRMFSSSKCNLEDKLTIISTGSIASGKSTFLSSLHATLGYDKVGIRIEKDKSRLLRDRKGKDGKRQATELENERRIRGLFRTNATDRPDTLSVYAALSGNRFYQVDFVAPGGHADSEKLQVNGYVNGLLYFVDLNLAISLAARLSTQRTLRAGNLFRGREIPFSVDNGESVHDALASLVYKTLKINRYVKPIDLLKVMTKDAGFSEEIIGEDKYEGCEALALALEPMVKDFPQFGLPVKGDEYFIDRGTVETYKREILGEVVQSVIDSNNTAVSAAEKGIPILGVGTHKNLVYGKLPQQPEELIKAVEGIFNTAIAKYAEYLKSHGLERGYKIISLDSLAGNPLRWQTIDLMSTVKRHITSKYGGIGFTIEETFLNRKNHATIRIAQDMIDRALQHKGIEPEGLKILTYRELLAAKEPVYARR